jgi:hypothetical protein
VTSRLRSDPEPWHRWDDVVSDAGRHGHEVPHGTSLLPRDLDEHQLATAPVLGSADALLIDDLSVADDDAFFAAIGS